MFERYVTDFLSQTEQVKLRRWTMVGNNASSGTPCFQVRDRWRRLDRPRPGRSNGLCLVPRLRLPAHHPHHPRCPGGTIQAVPTRAPAVVIGLLAGIAPALEIFAHARQLGPIAEVEQPALAYGHLVVFARATDDDACAYRRKILICIAAPRCLCWLFHAIRSGIRVEHGCTAAVAKEGLAFAKPGLHLFQKGDGNVIPHPAADTLASPASRRRYGRHTRCNEPPILH